MRINAAFQGKQLSMEEAPCEVRKVISLSDKEYAFFKKHLMYEYDFLRKNADQMGFRNGTRQCVLVMGETSEDGVLVDSSGYAYARYTAPFLGARSYMTLREQNLQANGELKNLTADDLAILHAKHTLWVYGAGGEQADFSHCRIAGLSLGNMQFNGACFRDAVLEDVDFGSAGVCGADFSGARFVHCRMDGMAAEECDFRNAVFENCTLAQTHLTHSNLTGATMKDCVLCGADLRNCCMEKFSLEDTDLEDAYIQGVMKKEQDWKEDLLYKTLRVQIDREYYCQKADLRFLEDVNLKCPKSMSEFETLWYNGSSRRGVHYDSTRYHALNLHSVFSKGTIEFRMFNSTLHAGEVKSYIQLCLAISHQALIQQRAMRTRTQSENEKYTFRTWLLRLGLIGDEFKTARQHLLKNLDGNIAWKDPAQAIRQRERQMQQRLEQAQSSAVQQEPVGELHQQQEEAPAFSMEEQR